MRILLIALCLFFVCGCGWIIYEDGRPIGSYAASGPYGDRVKNPHYLLTSSGLSCSNATRAGYHYGVDYCEWDCAYLYPMDIYSIAGVRLEYSPGASTPLRRVQYHASCR